MCRAIQELTDTSACPPQGARTQPKQLTSLLLSEDSDSRGLEFMAICSLICIKMENGERDSAHEIELVRC